MISYIILVLAVASVVMLMFNLIVASKSKKSFSEENIASAIRQSLNFDLQNFAVRLKETNEMQVNLIKMYNEVVTTKIDGVSAMQKTQLEEVEKSLKTLTSTNEYKLDKLVENMNISLDKITKTNEQKLEQMRLTVDEKLSDTLNKRLSQSFELINKSLEGVSTRLGEIKSLESGVGDLRKMLSGVKTRGIFGEIQLGAMLEQFLSPMQFEKNVSIKPNTQERVDFAILLPSNDEQNLLLPVDAKFPIEDYAHIQNALEKGDVDEILTKTKQLERRIKEEAKKIRDKYIDIPKTTDFALLYLPIEGLFAEVLRIDGLFEYVQREYKVTICGPTTLSALLNTYQMGFRTNLIQKRSSEIVSMLSVFKKEFNTFVELLGKTQKKIDEASTNLSSATKKTEKIQKQLGKVSDLTIDSEKIIDYNDVKDGQDE